MIKYEINKLLHQKKLITAAVLVLAALYVYLAFTGAFDTFCGVSQEYFWANKDYRSICMSQKPAVVDDEWIASVKQEYKIFVDENRVSDEELKMVIKQKKAEGFQITETPEQILADPYNPEYDYLILQEQALNSSWMNKYTDIFYSYIPLAENPTAFIIEKNDLKERGYTEEQSKEYENMIHRRFSDFKPVVGYSLGWDVLCSVMQFLPYTLGMALLVVLGNLFSQEKTFSMGPVLRTAKHGRSRLLRTKLGLVFLVTTGLWFLFQFVMLIAVALTYTLQGGSCTALLVSCSPTFYGFSWFRYYLVQCAFSYFGTLVFALFICCTSSILPLRLSMPFNLVLLVLTGQPMEKFQFWECAFSLIDKVQALAPAQLMSAYTTLPIYQSYRFGNHLVPLPYVTAAAISAELFLMLIFLKRREGGK
ncbi:MAG: hypothetical protein ACI4D7_08245 [Lachnospiraceae bacterium]